MEGLKVNVTSENGEVVIRTGEAAPLFMPVKYSFSGLIDAPASFYAARTAAQSNYFNPKDAVVMVDLDKRQIQLIRNVNDTLSDHITGTIFGESFLPKFKINTGECWTPQDLSKFLKRNKFHFESHEQSLLIVSKLNKLKVETNATIQADNDKRGNKSQSFEQKTSSEIPESFVLNMPIFQNGQPLSFKVNIEFDVQGSSVFCYLESDDLHQITKDQVDAEITKWIDYFKSSGIPILYK